MRPSILILHASGANRDAEAARACEAAGGAPEIVHINQLRRSERTLADYQMLLLPGGFSYGDALGAGARLALDLQVYFHDQLHAFIDRGALVLGICNGFQTLVKAGVLPGARKVEIGRLGDLEIERPGEIAAKSSISNLQSHNLTISQSHNLSIDEISLRRVTLTENASGHFECRWVHLAANRQATAPFLRELDELIFCPVAHGEGNVQVKDAAMLAEIEQGNLVAFRYVDAEGRPANGVYPLNPNGSVADIAGLCNRRGNVVGLMPHPEDHIWPVQNPLGGAGRLGLAIFQAMIGALQ
ncbi:MAG TPA: phosphoribosylformylglycinamidine synthase I [Chloroflexi bacterium]|nr:phosphoribosylformylglycinamidine synthase I [Chloroflexota bacterium]